MLGNTVQLVNGGLVKLCMECNLQTQRKQKLYFLGHKCRGVFIRGVFVPMSFPDYLMSCIDKSPPLG